jgi:hypothetical protein
MDRPLPFLALALGLLGLIPFIATGLACLLLVGEGETRALVALIAYGGVILAFLGGVHWGFALDAGRPSVPEGAPQIRAERLRLALGVLPSLVGWAAIMLPLVVAPSLSLVVLILGFIGTTAVEARARRAGLMPRGYMGLRWLLSTIVVLVLIVVLLHRLLGGRIIF